MNKLYSALILVSIFINFVVTILYPYLKLSRKTKSEGFNLSDLADKGNHTNLYKLGAIGMGISFALLAYLNKEYNLVTSMTVFISSLLITFRIFISNKKDKSYYSFSFLIFFIFASIIFSMTLNLTFLICFSFLAIIVALGALFNISRKKGIFFFEIMFLLLCSISFVYLYFF